MADNIQALRVISQGGLNTSENYLLMSDQDPGQATRLVNYESNTDGGYRRINGFQKIHPEFYQVPGEGKTLGIWVVKDEIIAARKTTGSNTYKFWTLTGIGWEEIDTGSVRSSIGLNKVRGKIFNFGLGDGLVLVDGVNTALVFMNNTWYNLSSANSGGDVSPGGDQLIDAPQYVAVFRNHIFFANDPDFQALVVHSAPLDALNWEVSAGAGQLPTGFNVVQIAPFRDELYVFGREKIKRIVVSGTDFVLQDVTNSLGCIASDSVLEIGGNLIFWSSDGIRPIAGTDRVNDIELSLLSQKIQALINKYSLEYAMDNLVGVDIKRKTQFRYFLPVLNEDPEMSKGIIGYIRIGQGQQPNWEFGELIGTQASCVFSGEQSGSEIVLFGDYLGNVYQLDRGNSFDGKKIFSVYETPYYDLGASNLRKTLYTMQLFVKAEGNFSINYSVKYNWESALSINPSDYLFELSNATSVYDGNFEYDSGIKYAGNQSSVLKTNIQGTGFSFRYAFVTNDVNPSHIIQAFVTEYSVKGRQ